MEASPPSHDLQCIFYTLMLRTILKPPTCFKTIQTGLKLSWQFSSRQPSGLFQGCPDRFKTIEAAKCSFMPSGWPASRLCGSSPVPQSICAVHGCESAYWSRDAQNSTCTHEEERRSGCFKMHRPAQLPSQTKNIDGVKFVKLCACS